MNAVSQLFGKRVLQLSNFGLDFAYGKSSPTILVRSAMRHGVMNC
jgi:hypothetical protein